MGSFSYIHIVLSPTADDAVFLWEIGIRADEDFLLACDLHPIARECMYYFDLDNGDYYGQ